MLTRAREAQAQRNLYVQVARQAAVNLTTISYTEVDSDIQRILDSATGAFHDDFQNRSQPFVDVVKQVQSKSEGTVAEAGAAYPRPRDQAQVLVAVCGEDVDCRCAGTRPAQMAVADNRSENGRWRQGVERGVRAVSSQTISAEEGSAMSVDTDPITDASPPGPKDKHPSGGADVDVDERIDVADEAEAADEADLVDVAEAPAEERARFSLDASSGLCRAARVGAVLALGAGYLKW